MRLSNLAKDVPTPARIRLSLPLLRHCEIAYLGKIATVHGRSWSASNLLKEFICLLQ
jgi:hypothetical protein